MVASLSDAYQLFHDGSLALSCVEENGIRIDVDRLDRTIEEIGEKIAGISKRMKEDDIWKKWRRRFGEKSNIGSRPQLGALLYEEMGYKPTSYTSGGRDEDKNKQKPSVDKDALEKVDLDFVQDFIEIEKLKKLRTTYLIGIRREVVDGLLRPSFGLNLVTTFRGSCSLPNFQNIPIRDKYIGELIRSCFIPRDGHVIDERDYGALEFRINACHWGDKKMVEYASDPTKDIHRDIAMECYCLPKDQVSKDARYCAKNKFVFPTLYGSYYVNTAKNLWAAIEIMSLKTKDGIGLLEWLDDKGISNPRDFEDHIKGVERKFNEKFPEWSLKKEQWLQKYSRNGLIHLMTGFPVWASKKGLLSRNNLYNTPIQGPAFHILLWSLTQLVKWMRKSKMRSMIIGQIHDSIIGDIHKEEWDEYSAKTKEVMTVDVRNHFKWIVTPLEIEAKVSEKNWFEQVNVAV